MSQDAERKQNQDEDLLPRAVTWVGWEEPQAPFPYCSLFISYWRDSEGRSIALRGQPEQERVRQMCRQTGRANYGIWVSVPHRAMLTKDFWLITQILHNQKFKTFNLPSWPLTLCCPPAPIRLLRLGREILLPGFWVGMGFGGWWTEKTRNISASLQNTFLSWLEVNIGADT